MKQDDAICPKCGACFRRVELSSLHGTKGEFRCPVCDSVVETFDGSMMVAYRLTVIPGKMIFD